MPKVYEVLDRCVRVCMYIYVCTYISIHTYICICIHDRQNVIPEVYEVLDRYLRQRVCICKHAWICVCSMCFYASVLDSHVMDVCVRVAMRVSSICCCCCDTCLYVRKVYDICDYYWRLSQSTCIMFTVSHRGYLTLIGMCPFMCV